MAVSFLPISRGGSTGAAAAKDPPRSAEMDDTISATTASGPTAPCFAAFGDLRAPAVGPPDLSLSLLLLVLAPPIVVRGSLPEDVSMLLELEGAAPAPAGAAGLAVATGCCAVPTACGCLSLALLLLLLDETPA